MTDKHEDYLLGRLSQQDPESLQANLERLETMQQSDEVERAKARNRKALELVAK